MLASVGDKRLPQWSDQSIHVELTQICYKSLCTTYYLMAYTDLMSDTYIN